LKKEAVTFIDDYAHHPEEIRVLLESVKEMFPDRKVTAIFQPHLFSRTKDLADGFAKALSIADEVLLLEIYPARELPMEGVTSDLIFQKLTCKEKINTSKGAVVELVKDKKIEVLVTIGAGDIDKLISPLKEVLEKKK
jgi:UDP-N-acetylmuramate--alanine ligase